MQGHMSYADWQEKAKIVLVPYTNHWALGNSGESAEATKGAKSQGRCRTLV